MNQINYFLIVFDRNANELLHTSEFSSEKVALEALFDEERTNGANSNLEIVLVGASSLEVVKTTHSHYFKETSKDDILRMATA